MNNFQRSLDLIDLVQTEKCATDASVQAHDTVVDDGSEGKPVEEVVDFVEDRVGVGGFFTQATAAFFSKSEGVVDPLVLMVAS